MLKLTIRRFAILGLSGILSASTGVAFAQLTPTPAKPRLDTPRTNEAEPEADSRAGGALAQDADPVDGADVVDDADLNAAASEQPAADADARNGTIDVESDDLDFGDVETTTFLGPLKSVGKASVTVKVGPPHFRVPKEQVFKVTNKTVVVVDGKRLTLDKIHPGSTIRVMALTGDPEIAAGIVATTPPAARKSAQEAADRGRTRNEGDAKIGQPDESEDLNPKFDIYPDSDSAPTPPRRPDVRVARRAMGSEEAVLSLGIEVYGSGPSGGLVTEMLSTSPAADAGMLIGDLLIAVNRKPIPDPELIEQLMAVPDRTTPIELTVVRGGQELQLSVSPWEMVDNGLITPQSIHQAMVGHGIAVGNVPVTLPLGITGLNNFANGGVTITGAENALLGGLLPNDVVVGVNGQPVRDRAAFLGALRGLPGDANTFGLDVLRNGQRTTLDVPVNALGSGFQTEQTVPQESGTGFPREGRSGAAQPGSISEGGSNAGDGNISEGRSNAAPANNLEGIPAPNSPQQQPATGTGPGGTGTGGTGTGGTGTGGAGGTGTPQ